MKWGQELEMCSVCIKPGAGAPALHKHLMAHVCNPGVHEVETGLSFGISLAYVGH